MNVGLYQSAMSLSSLERWQDAVSQNITSSQVTGYRARTVNFSAVSAGELQAGGVHGGPETGMPMLFPSSSMGISFIGGETQPTRRELDVAIQGQGFFEVQRPDGSHAYTRNGEFRLRSDRTLVTGAGDEVPNEAGSPIVLPPTSGTLVVNEDGTIFQGDAAIGKFAIRKFADNSQLTPMSGGYFAAGPGAGMTTVEKPELLQGYIEGSNVTPLREMVDLVLISRAYEANQKVITNVDQQMQKTLDALG